ncbi:UPF0182 family protein [Intrasporangium calvum]|uniref:UPF0182 protein Intca_2539 n=1 Tax=Intrasporangium calvum (strain ATCC 23552 / DSM 43043 / JCM 3097 / NBRC 12989 / NCIMB 10167 / NRRL B-3866 / 7 KIP) TaxID=710696 RepID=E6S7U9_INTC7|nr:UPF0182 family protein [Intrasporangium calvum]ADU49045.1 protein of unknown function UPF0182 [Intrasporangium calvum DSM 43043]
MSDSDFGPTQGPFGDGGEQGPARRAAPLPPNRSPLITALVIAFALLLVVATLATFWTEVLWYQSVDFSSVFATQLVTKIVLGLAGGLFTAAVVWSSIHVAFRNRPIYAPSPETQAMEHYRQLVEPMRRTATVAAPLAIGLFAGLSAATQWDTFLLWRNGTQFGTTDPEFGLDIGFYVFELPWINFIVSFLTMVLVLGFIAAAFTHYLYGGVVAAQRMRSTQAARVHLSIIAATLVLVRAVAFWIDRYNLANAQSTRMTGIQYTEAHAVIPTKAILAIAALMCAGMFVSTIWTRSWRLPLVGVAVLAVVVVAVGGIYPALVQSLKVRPSEKSLELPYIQRNIDATRKAYGFDGVKVEKYDTTTTASPGQLRNDADTIPGIRLIDPNVVSPTFKQLEASKGYYQFADVLDVDRYDLNGELTDTVIAVRELDLTGVPDGQRNWLNDHTVYTHGYGVVAAKGNTREDDGRPSFFESQIGTTGVLGEYEPRIYFGESSPEYSIVGAGKKEFDYLSEGNQQVTNSYAGAGGVDLDAMRRLAYAFKYREINFLLSDAVTNDSRLIDHRIPRERIERVAPWLTLDGNAYPVVVDGRVMWVIDGYTTTDMYPYSEMATLDAATSDAVTRTRDSVQAIRAGQVNYVRNSVKATVDAYDGTVTLYQWDDQDPILAAWMKIFPDAVTPLSEVKGSLMEHLRYPEDLFKIQRQLLTKYHETDPASFYGGQTFWRVPLDPTRGANAEQSLLQPPYYLSLAMPGQPKPSFSLTSTFMPVGDRNLLTGFLAADGDAGSEDGKRAAGYGALRLLEPSNTTVKGPGQVYNDMRSSQVSSTDSGFGTLAQFISTTALQGAEVTFGNQLTLPVGGGVLYVQPIYVQASGAGAYPRLSAVAVSFGEKIAWAGSLDDALNDLFGGSSGAAAGDQGTDTPVTPPGTPTGTPTGSASGTPSASPTASSPAPTGTPDANALRKALADADAAFRAGEEALRNGDFAAYGQAQERLKEALARAAAAAPATP